MYRAWRFSRLVARKVSRAAELSLTLYRGTAASFTIWLV